MKKQRLIPRGIRNNNPTNIRIGNTWLGEVREPTETEFEQFVSMDYGLRAAFVILRRYIRRFQRNTVERIITSWTPANENNTKAYIDTVCRKSGLDPNEELHFENKEKMVKLVDAMCCVECGQHIPLETIMRGYDMA